MPHTIRGAKRVSRCEECQHPRKAVSEAAYFDYAIVKNSQQGAESRSWLVLDRTGKRLREPCIAKEQNSKILNCFLQVLQTRYGNIPVYRDQEECLREVVHNTAGRLGLPTGVTAVEQSQANGRAEQRVRALRERLQIMVEDARRRGAEIIPDHPVAQWK